MDKLLNALGLMRVSEHEVATRWLREQLKEAVFDNSSLRANIEAEFRENTRLSKLLTNAEHRGARSAKP